MARERHSARFYDLLNKQILLENKINNECVKVEEDGLKLPTKSADAFRGFIFGHDMKLYSNLPAYELEAFERKYGWVRRTHLAYKRVNEQLAKSN